MSILTRSGSKSLLNRCDPSTGSSCVHFCARAEFHSFVSGREGTQTAAETWTSRAQAKSPHAYLGHRPSARAALMRLEVLWKVYAGCLDGDEERINRMIEAALAK
ncbi:hypothetical protein [Actinoallomurus acaciae]|uniref:Uncharacterized protein n=1 Tax=Actinoallomurus acaciae TaxID=502577 RepID=A0ABV5YGL6_9ACTN